MAGETQTAEFLAELAYRDPEAALDWLAQAFGFETRILVTGPDGKLIYAESGAGGTTAAILPEAPPVLVSPLERGGVSSCTMHLRFPVGTVDIDAHFARAKAAGAQVLREPRQEFYGDLEYLCADPEGHLWNFGVRTSDAPSGPPPEGVTVRFPGGRSR